MQLKLVEHKFVAGAQTADNHASPLTSSKYKVLFLFERHVNKFESKKERDKVIFLNGWKLENADLKAFKKKLPNYWEC